MKVTCSVQHISLENDSGQEVDGVSVTCSRCGHTTESFGSGDRSIRRCLVLLREECPRDERNFYAREED